MAGYIWFHVVTSGRLWLESGDSSARSLGPSELVLVPHGGGHVPRSEPGVPAPGILELDTEAISDRYEVLRHGGGGEPSNLICGAVRFDHPAAQNLVASLPDVIHLRAGGSLDRESMHSILRLMAGEVAMSRSAFAAVSPSSSASRPWRISPAGGCTSRSTRSGSRDRASGSSPTDSATAPRRPSRVLFKRVIGTPPGAVRRSRDMAAA